MLFSLVTVTKDNCEGLKTTHKSILQQTCTDYEWIVIDGNSKDGTQGFLQQTNANWHSEPDTGLYDAMNKGIERAKGDYVLFLNAGDALAKPDTLERLAKTAQQNPDFIYGDSIENAYKKAQHFTNLPLNMFTHHQAMIYKCSILKDINYNLSYKISADYDLTYRFLKRSKNIIYESFPICIFESGGLSQTSARQGRIEQFQIRKNLNICNPLMNVIIYLAQTLRWNVRRLFPRFYWRVMTASAD